MTTTITKPRPRRTVASSEPETGGMSDSDHSAPPVAAPGLSGNDLYRAFVEYARADPLMLNRLAAAFDYKPPFRRSAPILPLPFKQLKTVEIAVEDAGPPRSTKRVRAEREALRFSCTIQVLTPASSQVSKPCWRGRAQFRNPARMALDAAKLRKEKKILQPYLDWLVNQVIPMATSNGWMIGCIRIATQGQGTPYANQQVIVAEQAGLESHSLAAAYLISGENIMVELPPFVSTTSLDNPLTGNFVMQSRGAHPTDTSKASWATGPLRAVS